MHIALEKGCFKVRGTKEDPMPYITEIKPTYAGQCEWAFSTL